MAEDAKHESDFSMFMDDKGKADWTSSVKTVDASGVEKMFSLWQYINAEAEKYQSTTVTTEETLNALMNDREARNKEIHDRELKYAKAYAKIEAETADATAKSDEKRLKQLEKRKKILEQAQAIEKKTAEIVSKYEEDMNARKAKKQASKEAKEKGGELLADGWQSGDFKEMMDGFMLKLTGGESGFAGVTKAIDSMVAGLADLAKKLDKSVQEIASYKSDWDTRLFGSGKGHTSLTSAIRDALGVSPYVKQADVLKKIDTAVDTGIAYNIEQRAFLETIKDDIAGTFDAFDSTLLQIIRVQQSDSTAARLGMEAVLNEYLNKSFQNTEYLSQVSDSVTGALYQATSLLTSEQSIGFEYQVQKWLGSLYSVGMSNQAVSSIAQALGQLAAGDVSGTGSGAGKLLVMAASRAGLSYSDLLTKGINNSDINTLMEKMVEYLGTIADTNKVVQTQLAAVYGLTTSDIQAVSNLSGADITNIFQNGLDYGGGVNALNKMARTIGSRVSMGEKLENLMDNFQYTLSTGIANNPAMYLMWNLSNMLDDLAGGIAIPAISTMFGGIDLETTVADLMRVVALSGGIFSGIGSIFSGLANNANGIQGVLKALGVSAAPNAITRGTGLRSSIVETTSASSYIGNSSGDDGYNSSMASAEDKKSEIAAQQEEEDNEIKLEDVNNTAIKIYELLETVITGGKLNVKLGDDFSFSGLLGNGGIL